MSRFLEEGSYQAKVNWISDITTLLEVKQIVMIKMLRKRILYSITPHNMFGQAERKYASKFSKKMLS